MVRWEEKNDEIKWATQQKAFSHDLQKQLKKDKIYRDEKIRRAEVEGERARRREARQRLMEDFNVVRETETGERTKM